nr:cytochrome c oxidase assembly factor Coa1 family protein [uncultured Flavobacterium sp.]
MDNELIVEKSWWGKNWKWFLPTLTLIFSLLFWLILSLSMDGNVTDIAQAYSDNSLYEKAIEKAKTNQRVLEVIGEIEPIDKLAILEGNAIYSNNNNSVEFSVRVKGSKGKGKMDISADKNGSEWKYKKISIRIKEPKEEIQILKDTI